jgi:uncharacterized membrane protein
VVGLSAAGFLIAVYLAVTKWTGSTALLCRAGGGCDVVQASRYAALLGLPTALWGAGLYAAVGGLALSGLRGGRWRWAFLLAVAGAAFSLYLTAVSLLDVRATCGWCLASAAIALALVPLLLLDRPGAAGPARSLRPGRLAWQGGATAVATVVAGAFLFAAPTAGDAAYQEALARHLAGSGAIFYGAYW